MPLNRVWIPSPNYSSRSGAKVRLIVLHTAEGATTYQSLGNYFSNASSQVSSHVGIDDTPNTVGEYVRRDMKAWTAANANPVAVQAEICAFARWDTATWHQHPNMLQTVAAWMREEANNYKIPLVRLTSAQAQSNGVGVCRHMDLGTWGGNHSDPGNGFPIDEVIAMAGGSITPQPPTNTPAIAPAFPGTLLVNFTSGHGTAQWQQQMKNRGWTITVDDMYGSQSTNVCRQFQAEKGLTVDGIVGPITWDAAWTAPVT